jgi:hypothetical protein
MEQKMLTDEDHDPLHLWVTEFGRIAVLRRHCAEIERDGADLSALAEAFTAWDRVEAELQSLHRALADIVIPGLPVETYSAPPDGSPLN